MYFDTLIQVLIGKTGFALTQILLNHQQKIYAYYYFTVFDDHPIKIVLYVSFRNKDMDIM